MIILTDDDPGYTTTTQHVMTTSTIRAAAPMAVAAAPMVTKDTGIVQPPPYDYSGYSQPQGYSTSTTHAQHVTTYSTTPGGDGIHVDRDYPKSIPGILKLVQVVLCLITLIISSFMWWGASGWGGFCAGTGFFCSLVWFCLYLFNINNRFHRLIFIWELVYYCVLCVFFCIAAIVAAATVAGNGAHIAFAIFGFGASIAFGLDAFFQFQRYRSGTFEARRVTTNMTTETQDPRY